MDKQTRTLILVATVYLLGFVVSFGPATHESERAEDAHKATCTPQPNCQMFGPQRSDGALKAMFWPLWLSYRISA